MSSIINNLLSGAAVAAVVLAVVLDCVHRSKRDADRRKLELSLLAECQSFIKARGVYWYSNDMRGPGAELVNRIEAVLHAR